MNFNLLYYTLILSLAIAAIYCFYSTFAHKSTASPVFKSLKKFVKSKKDTIKEIDDVFASTGLNITSGGYNLIRFSVLSVIFLVILYMRFYLLNVSRPLVLLWMVLIVISYPHFSFAGMKTPFFYIMQLLKSENTYKRNKEIYRAICQLKNLSIARVDRPVGSVYVIEELMKYTNYTKNIFVKMLSMWYQHDTDGACTYFSNAIGTREAKELSNIFKKLDYLNPAELKEQFEIYQNFVDSERSTKKMKRNELKGYFLYGLVIISVILISLNFLAIGVFIDQIARITNTLK